MDEQCRGCRCETCRWKGAGSLCHYNAYGQDASLCSQCADGIKRVDLAAWKVKSYACRGYEKRYNARQCAWDELGIDQATYESGRGSCVWGVFRLIRKIAAMHTLFGNLAGHTCGECRHFISGTYHDRILQKCDLYGLTHSAASDWIKRWPACGLFNRDYHGRPVITQLRRLQPAKSPTEITVPGQMRFDDLI